MWLGENMLFYQKKILNDIIPLIFYINYAKFFF